jgi:plastocyanin
MLDNHFSPARLVVRAGTRVRWVNRGQNIHTTTSLDGLWDSPAVDRRQSFEYTFTKPGDYQYLCRQHLLNGMTGIITVK